AAAGRAVAGLRGTRQSSELVESFLKTEHTSVAAFAGTLKSGLDAWSVGNMTLQMSEAKELPERTTTTKYRQAQLAKAGIEAGILERNDSQAIRYRSLLDKELRALIHE